MKLRNSEILTLLMLVAPTALMLQSCCCHVRETVDEEEHIEQPSIMMGVASAGTKAVIDGSDANARLANMVGQCFTGTPATLKQNAGFGVYSYKSISDKSTILFDNTQVYPDPAQYNTDNPVSTPWTYSPTRFWDMTASYQFIAYWPYLPNTTGASPYVSVPSPANPNAVEESEKVLTIHNIPNWQPANNGDDPDDYMIATSSGSYQSKYASTNGMVHFSFGHLLSQLVLQGYYVGIKENVVTIKSIKLNGVRIPVPNGKSSYAKPFEEQYAPSYDISKADNVEHTLYSPESPSTGMVLSQDTYYDTENGKNKDDGDDPITQPICRWLVVPSTGWGSISLDIQYSVEGASTFRSIVSGISLNSNDGTNERPGEMLSGKTYILTLMFDSSGGGIDVKTVWVNGWQPAPIGINHTVYNW